MQYSQKQNIFASFLIVKYPYLGDGTLVLKARTQQQRTSKTYIAIRGGVAKSANKAAAPGPSSATRMSQLVFADFLEKVFRRFFAEIFPRFFF